MMSHFQTSNSLQEIVACFEKMCQVRNDNDLFISEDIETYEDPMSDDFTSLASDHEVEKVSIHSSAIPLMK